MSESRNHIELVKIAYNYICTLVGESTVALVKYDSSDTGTTCHIGEFYPDVFYEYRDTMIIGEAKTILDFERQHSQQQYRAYLENCARFSGNTTLVISIPWQLVSCAKNYFRRLRNEISPNTGVVIIDELGKAWTI